MAEGTRHNVAIRDVEEAWNKRITTMDEKLEQMFGAMKELILNISHIEDQMLTSGAHQMLDKMAKRILRMISILVLLVTLLILQGLLILTLPDFLKWIFLVLV